MFNSLQGNLLSLESLAEDFELQHGISISKQAINERFNDRAVAFLKSVLTHQLSSSVSQFMSKIDSPFTACLVKDSSRFGLPDIYASRYKGHGGATNTDSMMSLQHEFDLFSGKPTDLRLTWQPIMEKKRNCPNICLSLV